MKCKPLKYGDNLKYGDICFWKPEETNLISLSLITKWGQISMGRFTKNVHIHNMRPNRLQFGFWISVPETFRKELKQEVGR